MALSPGSRVGSYEILAPIGAGGMGQVYRAKDLKLGRDLAIKVLRQDSASDPERLRRFEQEARAASALNHPNIITIHDIGKHDSMPYIAMEFVAGKTLRELISEGPLPTRTLLQLATQIAAGLAKAHSAGIVHRDLKPENLMVTDDGFVKILDFGLAKLRAPTTESDSEAATLTKEGVVLGTVGYMSPEQAMGRTADLRSDQFSFGAILYEMATGKRAFQRDSPVQTLSAIIEESPEPIPSSPDFPFRFRTIVDRCLSKAPEQRYEATLDLARDLKDVHEELLKLSPSGLPRRSQTESFELIEEARSKSSVERPGRWGKWGWGVAGLLAAVAAWVTFETFQTPAPLPRTSPLTSLEGEELDPDISPDGTQVAFVWNGGVDGFFHIYIKLVGGDSPLKLTGASADDTHPAWSPDGLRLAFLRHEDTHLYAVITIPALGGPERRLGHVTAASPSLAWSPDGEFLAVSDGYEAGEVVEPQKIHLLSTETGEKTRLTFPPADPPDNEIGDRSPVFSPDGRTLAFVRQWFLTGKSDVYLQSLNGGEPKRITFDNTTIADLDWTPDGKALVFSSRREFEPPASLASGEFNLWRIDVPGGTMSKLTFGENAYGLSISRVGDRLVYSRAIWQRVDIWRVVGPSQKVRSGPEKFISSTRRDFFPAYSPDGERIAITSDRSGKSQIWIFDSDGSNAVQLTSLESAMEPQWSPDGKHIAFTGDWEEDNPDIGVVGVSDGFTQRLTRHPLAEMAPSWSRDGQWIYFASDRSGVFRGWKVPAEGGEVVQVTTMDTGYSFESEDREFRYFSSIAPGEDVVHQDIYRVPVAGGEPELVLDKRPKYIEWVLWEESIVYINQKGEKGPTIELFDLHKKEVTELAALGAGALTWAGLSVSPDGQWILFTKQAEPESDLVLVENFR